MNFSNPRKKKALRFEKKKRQLIALANLIDLNDQDTQVSFCRIFCPFILIESFSFSFQYYRNLNLVKLQWKRFLDVCLATQTDL